LITFELLSHMSGTRFLGLPLHRKSVLWILLVLLLLGLHFYDAEADPSLLKTTEDIHDEAWWAENARQKVLYDRWTVDGIAGVLAAGPLTVAWHYGVFSVWGINFYSLRIIALLPFTLLVLALLFRKKRHESSEKNSLNYKHVALLLVSLPLVLDWSRLGHPEMLMACLGICSFMIGRREGKYNLVYAGSIAALGLFVKGSFVYHFLAIALVLSGTEMKHFIRRGIFFSFGAGLIVLPFWFGYFVPNAAFFETYTNLFAGEYYTWQQLLHPAGIVFRLTYLAEKSFVNDPLSSIGIALLLIRYIQGHVPRERFSFTALLAWAFALILLSDFSPRRAVFVLMLLPFALLEPQKQARIVWWKTGILYGLISLTLLPYCWPDAWLRWSLLNGRLDYTGMLWIAVFVHVVASMGLSYGIQHLKHERLKNIVFALPVFLWWILLQKSSWQRLNCGIVNEHFLTILIFAGALCLLICVRYPKHTYGGIAILSVFWIGLMIQTRSHQVLNAANYLKIHGKANEYAIGYGLPYTLTFLSPVSPVFHPESERKLPIRWCIGLSSPEFSNRTVESYCERYCPNGTKTMQTFPLYDKREEAWILERSI
jgi:hypothetical protein